MLSAVPPRLVCQVDDTAQETKHGNLTFRSGGRAASDRRKWVSNMAHIPRNGHISVVKLTSVAEMRRCEKATGQFQAGDGWNKMITWAQQVKASIGMKAAATT